MSDTSDFSSGLENEYEDSQGEYIEVRPERRPIRADKGKGVTRKRGLNTTKANEAIDTDGSRGHEKDKEEEKGSDDSDSSVEEVDQPEPTKKRQKKVPKELPRGTLKAVKARVPMYKHNMTWPVVSEYGISQILSILDSEALACMSDLQSHNPSKKLSKKQKAEEDALVADFQKAQTELVKRVNRELRKLPVPPATRDAYYSLDTLTRQNERLEAAAAAIDKQVADLEAEVEQEEAEMARDEAYLKELIANSRSQIRSRKALVRKQMAASAVGNGGVNFLEGIEVGGDVDGTSESSAAHYVELLDGAFVVDDSIDGLNIVGSSEGENERDSDEEVSMVDSDEEDAAVGFDDEDDELRVFQDLGMTNTQLDRIREELRRGVAIAGEEAEEDKSLDERDEEMAEMLARLNQHLEVITENTAPVASLLKEVSLCHSELAMLQRATDRNQTQGK